MPEQRTEEDRKQHLYLVFDDWNYGYSIRKVNLSRPSSKRCEFLSKKSKRSEQSSDSGEDSEQPALLSGSRKGAKGLPVFMRIRALRGYPQFFTSAFGTKIIAMHPVPSDGTVGVPVIDVQDHTVAFEPLLNAPVFPTYIPVGDDRLFHLDFTEFEILRKREPSGRLGIWKRLRSPPFDGWNFSYVVQPDGCILVSAKSGHAHGHTFIFDTKKYVWKEYSNWVFPFTGYGHYDPSLKGFVGLSEDQETLGYLYCCTMARTRTGDPFPELKCKEVKVYDKNPAEGQHVSATLVHMRQGKFCLVECVCTDNRPIVQEELVVPPGADRSDFMGGGPQGGRFMYHLKTFSLSYDSKGDLKLKNCEVHCYSLPHEARIGSIRQDPVAFWL